jgi:hypothetical protein
VGARKHEEKGVLRVRTHKCLTGHKNVCICGKNVVGKTDYLVLKDKTISRSSFVNLWTNVKLSRTRNAGVKWERKYSSFSFFTSALGGGVWSASCPGETTPRYPLYRRLGGPQSRSGHRGYRKNPLPLSFYRLIIKVISLNFFCQKYPRNEI